MLDSLVCRFSGHQIDRDRVWHDTLNHRTTCTRCGCLMVRETSGWREFNLDRDADTRRKPHPNFAVTSL